MQDPLDIRHLRYFLAVAEAGSFSRAADRLGISQPSVSQQMRDLEAGLRVSLFQRRGKRILLTPRDLIFQEHARAVLHQLENFLQELNSEPGQLRGEFHLGVIPVLNVPLVPHLAWNVYGRSPCDQPLPSKKSHPPKSKRRWKKAGWTLALDFSPATRRTCATSDFARTNLPSSWPRSTHGRSGG